MESQSSANINSLDIASLTGIRLNYAVWVALGAPAVSLNFNFVDSWMHSGPIIDRMLEDGKSYLVKDVPGNGPDTRAQVYVRYCCEKGNVYEHTSDTLLVSALRCFVATKLAGKLVMIPQDLVETKPFRDYGNTLMPISTIK
jgi:hypothetical protein